MPLFCSGQGPRHRSTPINASERFLVVICHDDAREPLEIEDIAKLIKPAFYLRADRFRQLFRGKATEIHTYTRQRRWPPRELVHTLNINI
jgi:hypothetical protein